MEVVFSLNDISPRWTGQCVVVFVLIQLNNLCQAVKLKDCCLEESFSQEGSESQVMDRQLIKNVCSDGCGHCPLTSLPGVINC